MHVTDPINHFDTATALVVVDMQNDFADPAGGLYVAGGDRIVDIVNAHIEAARAANALVVYTQDWHPETTPHFAKDGGLWPTHCVRDTWGAQLHPDLTVLPQAPIIQKGVAGEDGYSGFSVRDPVSGDEQKTALDQILRVANITAVVVVGLAGDVCVKETALDAARLGYQVTVPVHATAFVELHSGDREHALDELGSAGVKVSTT